MVAIDVFYHTTESTLSQCMLDTLICLHVMRAVAGASGKAIATLDFLRKVRKMNKEN